MPADINRAPCTFTRFPAFYEKKIPRVFRVNPEDIQLYEMLTPCAHYLLLKRMTEHLNNVMQWLQSGCDYVHNSLKFPEFSLS